MYQPMTILDHQIVLKAALGRTKSLKPEVGSVLKSTFFERIELLCDETIWFTNSPRPELQPSRNSYQPCLTPGNPSISAIIPFHQIPSLFPLLTNIVDSSLKHKQALRECLICPILISRSFNLSATSYTKALSGFMAGELMVEVPFVFFPLHASMELIRILFFVSLI